MKKLQSFYIVKIESKKLKDCKYKNINISFEEAQEKGYLIREGDSELLRFLRRYKKSDFSQEYLDGLLKQEKRIKKKQNSDENRNKLIEIRNNIRDLLFVPELLIVKFDNISHYKKIIQNGGIKLNNKNYVRLLSSAGQARKSIVTFIDEDFEQATYNFLNVDRDETYKINPNKYNAYVALGTSASHRVTKPRFCVIPDCEQTRTIKADYLTEQPEGIDPLVEERVIDSKVNLFDGEGLVSPEMMSVWKNDLDLDYLPSAVIFRGAWLKGLLITFDFHGFAKQNNLQKLIDIYGNEHDVNDIDVILTQSQFKLSGAYKNLEEYNLVCDKYDYQWAITRPSPKQDKNIVQMTYQYLQSMKIDTQEKIEHVCKDTVDWLNGLHGNDWNNVILFLTGGEYRFEDLDKKWFDSLDTIQKLLLLDKRFLSYEYIRKYVQRMIQKKIKESYIGILNVPGNYQFMMSDPFALCEHSFGLEVKGLLQVGKSYSQYWNKRNVSEVFSFRSPLTWRSEVNPLDLVQNEKLNYWYKYLYSGIVFNIYGDDFQRMAGGDTDGDICATTNHFSKDYIYWENRNIPMYERKTAEKKFINKNDLWQDDIRTFGSKIGLITNFGTSLFSMLEDASNKEEYNILVNRLISLNGYQSMEIDRAKAIKVFAFPNHFAQFNRRNEEDTDEDVYRKSLYNSVLIRTRPFFMKHIYNHYGIEYNKFLDMADKYFHSAFGCSYQELLKKSNRTEHEEKMIELYNRQIPLLDNKSTMNSICHYLENEIQKVKLVKSEKDYFLNKVLNIEYTKEIHDKLLELYKEFKSKNKVNDEERDIRLKQIRNKANSISSMGRELVYHAMLIDDAFMFKVFGEDLTEVLLEYYANWVDFPCLDELGEIEYLNQKYKIRSIDIA